MRTCRRRLVVGGAAVATALALGSQAIAAQAPTLTDNPIKGWCGGVVRPGAGDGISMVPVGDPSVGTAADGTSIVSYTFGLTLTGPSFGAGRKVHVADCAIVVAPTATPTTLTGLKSRFSSEEYVPGPFTTATVSLTVPAAVRICNEVKINSSIHHIRSNIVCSGPVAAAAPVAAPPAPAPAAPPASNVAGAAVHTPNTGVDAPYGVGLVLMAAGLGAVMAGRRLRSRVRR